MTSITILETAAEDCATGIILAATEELSETAESRDCAVLTGTHIALILNYFRWFHNIDLPGRFNS